MSDPEWYLNPPDDPIFSECDRCHGLFTTQDYLTKIKNLWLCEDCEIKAKANMLQLDDPQAV
jgi:hypothetical protein